MESSPGLHPCLLLGGGPEVPSSGSEFRVPDPRGFQDSELGTRNSELGFRHRSCFLFCQPVTTCHSLSPFKGGINHAGKCSDGPWTVHAAERRGRCRGSSAGTATRSSVQLARQLD